MTATTPTLAGATAKRSWLSLLGWAAVLGVLAWAWQGTEMDPGALVRNAGNMAELASDFYPPAFGNLEHYLEQMLVTIQIAIWGTLLAIVLAIPCSLLSSENLGPWLGQQPVRPLKNGRA